MNKERIFTIIKPAYRHAGALFLALAVFIPPNNAPAADRYVAHGVNAPDGNYLNWATAASKIQDAVNVSAAGETVWVGAGVYTSSVDQVVKTTNSLSLRGWPADWDGRTRIDRFSGRVDMGCYEYLPKGMIFKFR